MKVMKVNPLEIFQPGKLRDRRFRQRSVGRYDDTGAVLECRSVAASERDRMVLLRADPLRTDIFGVQDDVPSQIVLVNERLPVSQHLGLFRKQCSPVALEIRE